MRYFVTGGAGFIGSHLVDRLMEKGEVVVFDNLSCGRKEFLSQHLGRDGFTLIEEDLLKPEKIQEAIGGCDAVFHLAANPDIRLGTVDTHLDLEQGTLATYNTLEAARLEGIKKFVFSSSSVVYGMAQKMPTPESYGPLAPISLYGASKLACEGLITAFSHLYGMQSWIFRFGNIVGSRQTHGVIIDFIGKLGKDKSELEILGDGNQRKPYLHVSECVDGILFGFENGKGDVNIFNLGCQGNTSVTKIAELLVREMGLEPKLNFTGGKQGWKGDVPLVEYDTSRMEKLGWKARLASDSAVEQAVKELVEELCRQ